jgi:UDPglucose 6-dehydrogenase
MRIAEAVVLSNAARKRAMAWKIAAAMGGSLRKKTIGLLGLTFKPDTDDMREAPSINLAAGLSDLHASIRAYDPAGMSQAKDLLPSGAVECASEYEAAEGADAVVVVTEWAQFREIDFDRLKRKMRAPVMIDLRNIYRPEELAACGFRYYCIGAPQMAPALSVDLPRRSPPRQERRVRAIKPHLNGAVRLDQRRNSVRTPEANSA